MKQKYLFTALVLAACVGSAIQAQNPLLIPDTISGSVINLNLRNGTHSFYNGTLTQTMGANGNILGPTIVLNKGQQVTMNVTNNLTETTTIHWHGMHVAPENDGGPHVVIQPNTTWSPSFQVMDHASTHWYHPHLHEKTHDHVQKGIAGFIIVRDEQEKAINLPRTYGVDDFPLVIQTKSFDTANQIVTAHVASDTALMVNATLNPYLNVPAQVVRFRLLNGSSERVYNIGLSNNATFSVIGGDGGLLTAPVSMTRVLIAPGERVEILVDFAEQNGQTIFLKNYGTSIANAIYGARQPGMGAGQQIPGYTANPLNGADFNILQFNVAASKPNAVTTIPTALITHNPWAENSANATRTLTFMSMTMGPNAINGPFVINNAHFDMSVINFRVPFNNVEIWELRNQTPIAHPFHIHNVPFYILTVNGVAPPAHQRGRKDVVLVPAGNGVVRFITRFENFYNDTLPYMYHCHMLTHEDDGMMGQFVVNAPCDLLSAQPNNVQTTAGQQAQFSVQVNNTAGVTYQWQSNLGFGFQDLQNAGQYSGVNTATLTVNNVSTANNNQFFRCVVTNPTCTLTSNQAALTVNTTAIGQVANRQFLAFYPNPATNQLHIMAEPTLVGSNMKIFNSIGVLVYQSKLQHMEQVIELADFNVGVYMLEVNGVAYKFIKQ